MNGVLLCQTKNYYSSKLALQSFTMNDKHNHKSTLTEEEDDSLYEICLQFMFYFIWYICNLGIDIIIQIIKIWKYWIDIYIIDNNLLNS